MCDTYFEHDFCLLPHFQLMAGSMRSFSLKGIVQHPMTWSNMKDLDFQHLKFPTINIYKYLSISINIYQYLLISINIYQYLSISIRNPWQIQNT